MGLDSVELVMEFEDYFLIEIPDHEAAKMGTIKSVVDYISTHLAFADRGADIKNDVLKRLSAAFASLNETLPELQEKVFQVVPLENRETWKAISIQTGYDISKISPADGFDKFLNRIFKQEVAEKDATVGRLIDLLCATNYEQLIIKGQVQNRYEIMIAVMGITIDKMGNSPFEVFEDSSFTNDLGVD
ncbi:MAG: acyl carrier protein [Sphingobacteriaceae bacterium]|nr:MAG: acyl carrier protein [Sphingobacteriaceae bacterium]